GLPIWCPVCFFFQAEDGIRDFHVTGVQTCALPICWQVLSSIPLTLRRYRGQTMRAISDMTWGAGSIIVGGGTVPMMIVLGVVMRSEERRVGKECRCRRAPDPANTRAYTRTQASTHR